MRILYNRMPFVYRATEDTLSTVGKKLAELKNTNETLNVTSELSSVSRNPEPCFLGPGTESCLSPDLGCSVDLQDLIPHPKK